MHYNVLSKVIFFFGIIGFVFACSKPKNKIEDVPVNFYININDPLYRDLRTVGNSLTVTGGHAGIIIYRHTETDFIAFDRICPHEIKPSCRLEATDDDLFYRCGCCHTPYLLLEGIGQSIEDTIFPGTGEFLKEYRTYYDGVGRLHIKN